MSYLKFIITELLGLLFYPWDYFIPKDARLIVFCNGKKRTWGANLRVLFDHIERYPRFHTIILSSGHIPENFAIKYKKIIIKKDSLKGLLILLKARILFISHGVSDTHWNGLFVTRSHKRSIINLWHGVPIKKIGYHLNNSLIEKLKLDRNRQYCSFIISNSSRDQETMSAAFNLPKEKVPITGLPKNDLMNPHKELPSDLKEQEDALLKTINNKKLCFYAPTFRNKTNGVYPFNKNELNQLNDFLKKNDMLLGIRAHANKSFSFQDVFGNFASFVDLNRFLFPEVQIILRLADILVTDYSGIWVDYLLTRKPILGFAYDLETYKKIDRGFIYPFEDYFPGPISYNFEDLIANLNDIILNKFQIKELRKHENFLKLFHSNIEINTIDASSKIIQEMSKRLTPLSDGKGERE